MADNKLVAERIAALKEQKQAVILAHYYTAPEVQQVADFVGDSLALAIEAAKTDARVILFAGVHFMAETAKVLCPDRKVLIPDPEAGCSLADSCRAEDLAKFLVDYPDHKVVSYVNTTVGVKALTDVCCTSSNALKVVQSIPDDQPSNASHPPTKTPRVRGRHHSTTPYFCDLSASGYMSRGFDRDQRR